MLPFRRRWRFWLLAGIAILVLAFCVRVVIVTTQSEATAFAPRRGPIARPASLEGLEGLTDTSFTSCGVTIRGWWVPSKSGAAVVLVHGTDADRSDMLAEMRALGRAGFGALAYDAPGHGESEGVVTFGSCEVKTVVAAAEHVAQLPGVDGARVGAIGASAGGAIVGVASAETSRLRAVALVAAFTDSDEQTRFVYRGKGPLSQEPALAVDRAHMIDGPLRAIDAVRKTKARAVLIVQGTDDPIVPPYMAKQLYEAVSVADPPINELWMIEHGRHLHLEEVTGGAYGKRLVELFDRGLQPGR